MTDRKIELEKKDQFIRVKPVQDGGCLSYLRLSPTRRERS